jgi:hypothetical protein
MKRPVDGQPAGRPVCGGMAVDRAWLISIHESGHATVARLLRLPNCGGACITEPDAHARFDHGDDPEASVVALMAGAAAETVVLGDYDRDGVLIDRARWEWRAERHGLDERVLWNQTMRLVRRHQPLIECLADMLWRAKILDGRAIDKIVGG